LSETADGLLGVKGRGRAAPPSLAQKLLRGGLWAIAGKVSTMPVAVLLATLLARLLEPAQLGGYFLAMSVVAAAAALVQLGLGRAMIKLVASSIATGRPGTARWAVFAGIGVTTAAALCAVILLATAPGRALADTLEGGDLVRPVLLWVGLLTACFALTELLTETLRGFHDQRAASLLGDQLLQRALLCAGLAIWLLLGTTPDVEAVLVAALAAAAVATALALWLTWRHVRFLGHRGEAPPLATVLREGLPFMLMRGNFWLLSNGSIFALGIVRPAEEVALFGAATYLALLIQAPVTAANAVFAPVAAELFGRERTGLLGRVARGTSAAMLLPALALVVVLLLFGGPILELVFGPAYGAGHTIAVILAVGRCLATIFAPCAMLLAMSDRQADLAWVMSVSSIVSIVGYALAGPVWGGAGIAAVVALSLAVQGLLLGLACRRRLGIAVYPHVTIAAAKETIRLGLARRRGRSEATHEENAP